MNQIFVLGLKMLMGGALVVLFAFIGELVKPKRFAGLFSAAPSIAVASLAITWLQKGPGATAPHARGMLGGAAAFVLYCAVVAIAVRRMGVLAGSAVSFSVWLAAAGVIYIVALR